MKSHELAQLLLSLPDVQVGVLHNDSESDYKWATLVSGVDANVVKVGNEKIIVFTESYVHNKGVTINPSESFDILDIDFSFQSVTDIDGDSYEMKGDSLCSKLHMLFTGTHEYNDNIRLNNDALITLITGYDADTWEPITIKASIEEAKQYILDNYKLVVADDWYFLEDKSEQYYNRAK
jgi:hypothetical protein